MNRESSIIGDDDDDDDDDHDDDDDDDDDDRLDPSLFFGSVSAPGMVVEVLSESSSHKPKVKTMRRSSDHLIASWGL